MGVYYFFYNKSKNFEQNKHVLSGHFCDFVTKFDSDSKEIYLKYVLKKIIGMLMI